MTFEQMGYLATGAGLTVALLLIGHWFPYATKLTRIQAYIYGTTSIAAGFGLFVLLNGDSDVLLSFCVIVVAAGMAVIGAYWIDGVMLRLRQARRGQYGVFEGDDVETDQEPGTRPGHPEQRQNPN